MRPCVAEALECPLDEFRGHKTVKLAAGIYREPHGIRSRGEAGGGPEHQEPADVRPSSRVAPASRGENSARIPVGCGRHEGHWPRRDRGWPAGHLRVEFRSKYRRMV